MPHDLIAAFKKTGNERGLDWVRDEHVDNCFRCGSIYVLFSSLVASVIPDPENLRIDLLSQVESQLQVALDLRKKLPQAVVNDLNLILVSEPTQLNKIILKDLCNEIERDDRVCRKMVWLKGPHGKTIDNFLDRTFLARPWASASPATADALRPLTDDLGISNNELFDALMDDDLDGEEFVRKLMTIMGADSEQ